MSEKYGILKGCSCAFHDSNAGKTSHFTYYKTLITLNPHDVSSTSFKTCRTQNDTDDRCHFSVADLLRLYGKF